MPGLLSFGSAWVFHAFAHSIAFSSMHIGSLAGVAGSSGIQVHLLDPLRSTAISLPSFPGWSTMVASFKIAAGAALMAFWIFHCLLLAGALFFDEAAFVCAATTAASINSIVSKRILFDGID